MAKDFLKSNPAKELEGQMNQDFNKLIRKIHKSLSTKKRSPVYTGFFASSWKAQTMGVKAVDRVEDFQPWANIKKQKKTLGIKILLNLKIRLIKYNQDFQLIKLLI